MRVLTLAEMELVTGGSKCNKGKMKKSYRRDCTSKSSSSSKNCTPVTTVAPTTTEEIAI